MLAVSSARWVGRQRTGVSAPPNLFREAGRPVGDQNERGGDTFRVRGEDEALAVRGNVVGGSKGSGIAHLEQRAYLVQFELSTRGVHAGGVEGTIRPDEVYLLAIPAPGWEGASGLRNLPPAGAAGKVGNVNLLPSRLSGTVGQPAAVGREAELKDPGLRRLWQHDGERFLFAHRGQRPHAAAGRTALLHVDEVAAIGRPLWR